jgi:hypothetical protein
VKSLVVLPLKGFDKFIRRDVVALELELGKQFLKLIKNTVFSIGMYLFIVGPLINAVSELGSHEKSLDEAVDVARSSDVGQSFIIGFGHLKSIDIYEGQTPQEENITTGGSRRRSSLQGIN